LTSLTLEAEESDDSDVSDEGDAMKWQFLKHLGPLFCPLKLREETEEQLDRLESSHRTTRRGCWRSGRRCRS
jgi:hypothetical protein